MTEEKGLSTSGTKQELTNRLIAHASIPSQEETSEVESEDMEEPPSVDETPESIVTSMAIEQITDEVGDVSPMNGHQVFTELPSRLFIAGGHHYKPFLATLAVIFLLMFSFGWQDYYSDNFSFEGSDKEYVDCLHITYYSLGDGNDSSYDPTNQANIDCAEMFDVSPNWWQEEADSYAQSILDAILSTPSSDDTNHSGFVWTQSGIDIVAYYGATYFSQNMSIYGDPITGDEFTAVNLATWNGFGAGVGAGNDSFEDLLAGGTAPFNIPTGIVEYAPTGYIWLQSGIDIVTFYGETYFSQNMSIYGYPSAGDVFTENNLAIWNGFGAGVGAGNDSFDDLLAGGPAPFNIPAGIVGFAPTGYNWLQSGIDIVTFYGFTYFSQNMSVYDYPSAGDVFTENNLAVWNGFGAGVGAGNDTFVDLLAGGAAPFNIPAGIIMSTVELVNQTPVVTNVSIVFDNATTPFTYSCDYVFVDAQNGTDNSTIAWFVNGSYAGNSTNYTVINTGGISLMCIVTPYDAWYWGIAVESESLSIIATDE
jgi:hypothetical protein